MPKPLMDGSIEYEDGTEATMSQMASILRSSLCSEFYLVNIPRYSLVRICVRPRTLRHSCAGRQSPSMMVRESEREGRAGERRARGRGKRQGESERERDERGTSEKEERETERERESCVCVHGDLCVQSWGCYASKG